MRKFAFTFVLGVFVGAAAVAVPAIYEVRSITIDRAYLKQLVETTEKSRASAVEEKNTAVIMASNLVQSEPAAIEQACRDREHTAKTAAIAEITAKPAPSPAPPAAAPAPANWLEAVARFLFR